MNRPDDKDRPEAGADTAQGRRGEGSKKEHGQSGGTRTPSGGTYGDFVPSTHTDDKDDAERIAEDNRNKDFDTTHVHSGTTTRKV